MMYTNRGHNNVNLASDNPLILHCDVSRWHLTLFQAGNYILITTNPYLLFDNELNDKSY